MRSILVILGICMLIPNIVFGIDKSWFGKYESTNGNGVTVHIYPMGFDGLHEDTISIDGTKDITMDNLKFVLPSRIFLFWDIKQINKNTLQGKYGTQPQLNTSGSITVQKNGNIITVNPNVKIDGKEDVSVVKGKSFESRKYRGNELLFDKIINLVKSLKYKKVETYKDTSYYFD